MYLGIDIGGTAIKIGFINEDGTIIKKENYKAYYLNNSSTLLDESVKATLNFIDKYKDSFNRTKAVGISATGQISKDTGIVIGSAGHIPGWKGTNLKKIFEELLKKEVRVINDANSMVIAESFFGAAKGFSNVVGLTVGTGIGGGIIVDNKLLVGNNGIGGEIGQMIFDRISKKTKFDRKRTYENFASTASLTREVKKIGYRNIDGRYIMDNLLENNDVKEIYNKWLSDVAKGIISLIHIFNPEIVVIGGGISIRSEFMKPLEKIIRTNIIDTFNEDLEIVSARLGNDAGFIGAICSYLGE